MDVVLTYINSNKFFGIRCFFIPPLFPCCLLPRSFAAETTSLHFIDSAKAAPLIPLHLKFLIKYDKVHKL